MRKFKVMSLFIFLCALIASTSMVFAAAGDVWISPTNKTVNASSTFDLEVLVNSGTQNLGAYQFNITFNKDLINVDTTKGIQGVDAGVNGFVTAVNTNNNAGSLIINGFDVYGKGPGSSLKVLIIHFKALNTLGSTNIGLSVEVLTDINGDTIGTPSGQGATVTIQQPVYSLTVGITPNNSGKVTGSGINCPNDCSQSYDKGTNITLTATPNNGFVLDHWSGCDSTNGNQCTISINSDKSVNAYFASIYPTLSVTVNPSNGGTVAGNGINCPGDCSETYDKGTNITLTATLNNGFVLDHWSGCDSTNGNQCTISINSDKSVNAYFNVISGLPVPLGHNIYSYLPVETAIKNSGNPFLCRPFAVGDVVGGTLSLQVKIPPFSGPVDIYLAIYAPQVDRENLYMITSNLSLQPLSMGLVPWRGNTYGDIEETIADIDTSGLSPGIYYLYLVVTPAGSTDSFYLWTTYFVSPTFVIP